jgi:hypothetical protein
MSTLTKMSLRQSFSARQITRYRRHTLNVSQMQSSRSSLSSPQSLMKAPAQTHLCFWVIVDGEGIGGNWPSVISSLNWTKNFDMAIRRINSREVAHQKLKFCRIESGQFPLQSPTFRFSFYVGRSLRFSNILQLMTSTLHESRRMFSALRDLVKS